MHDHASNHWDMHWTNPSHATTSSVLVAQNRVQRAGKSALGSDASAVATTISSLRDLTWAKLMVPATKPVTTTSDVGLPR